MKKPPQPSLALLLAGLMCALKDPRAHGIEDTRIYFHPSILDNETVHELLEVIRNRFGGDPRDRWVSDCFNADAESRSKTEPSKGAVPVSVDRLDEFVTKDPEWGGRVGSERLIVQQPFMRDSVIAYHEHMDLYHKMCVAVLAYSVPGQKPCLVMVYSRTDPNHVRLLA